jgi:tetratricopeptide (TPR) repeat protein
LVLAAQLTHRFEFDWVAAHALFERAVRAAPGSAYVRHSQALSLMMRGDFERAEADLAVARQLDPIHLGLRAHQALLYLYRRDWPAADAALQAMLDMGPDNVLGMSLKAYCALCQGDAASALQQYQAVSRRHPQLSIGPAGEIQSMAMLGQRQTALERLEDLASHWTGRYLSPYQLAMARVRLGEPSLAIQLLRRAVVERDPNALCLPVDPAFDSLGGDPGFQALRQTVLGSRLESD